MSNYCYSCVPEHRTAGKEATVETNDTLLERGYCLNLLRLYLSSTEANYGILSLSFGGMASHS